MSTYKYTNREYSFDEVCKRAFEVLGSVKQKDLANALGISAGDLANRRKREAIPYDKLIEFSNTRNVDLNWLLTGQGEMYRDAANVGMALTPEQQALLTLFNDLEASDRREILQDAEKKKRLQAIEERLTKLEATSRKG